MSECTFKVRLLKTLRRNEEESGIILSECLEIWLKNKVVWFMVHWIPIKTETINIGQFPLRLKGLNTVASSVLHLENICLTAKIIVVSLGCHATPPPPTPPIGGALRDIPKTTTRVTTKITARRWIYRGKQKPYSGSLPVSTLCLLEKHKHWKVVSCSFVSAMWTPLAQVTCLRSLRMLLSVRLWGIADPSQKQMRHFLVCFLISLIHCHFLSIFPWTSVKFHSSEVRQK